MIAHPATHPPTHMHAHTHTLTLTITPTHPPTHPHTHTHTHTHTHLRGDFKTMQCGSVAVAAWLDRRLVTVMSTAHDPTGSTTVLRRQKDGTRQPVTCPIMIRAYNELMGGVDTGDQARGYYRMRTKFRKFYMYIFTFIKDVAVTNSYILYKNHSPTPKLKSIKDFRLELATQLIGTYNSRKLPGRQSCSIRPLPLTHFPTKNQEGKRGRCKRCQPKRTDTPWFCTTCNEWLCHNGDLATDCFLAWHKNIL